MAELLLEVFSEEIPARMQQGASEQVTRLVTDRLEAADLSYGVVEAFFTPRRLTLIVDGLPTVQEDKVVEQRGPRVDAPEKALEGFLRSLGLAKEQLEVRDTEKGQFYFAVKQTHGKLTAELLVPLLSEVLQEVKWPKSMRWNDHAVRWVRPLSHICCVFDGNPIPVVFGHVVGSNQSRGHRFLSGEVFEVANANDYKKKLEERFVVLHAEQRRAMIVEQAQALAEEKGLTLKDDPVLVDEVAGLVEYPVVLLGAIDEDFMRVPQEVLISSMRSHQKYFSLLQDDGSLAPYFIVVANIATDDGGAVVLAGNERVLRARLSDAAFFWDADRKQSLEDRVGDLQKVVFHARLGTVLDKVKRVGNLAKTLSVWVPHANLMLVERAAQLCKADLTTGMVGEFADLQGIMGSYYARHDQEDDAVVRAVSEHYRPQGPSDYCPKEPVSVAVALADKMDTLVGLFLVDEKPTGSKDPFALRRAALGIIRIILENELRVPLKILIDKAISQYPKAILKPEKGEKNGKKLSLLKRKDKASKTETPKQRLERVRSELLLFFGERLKAWLKQEDVRHDLIASVFDDGGEDDLYRVVKRVNSLETFLATEDGSNLLAAFKRATNIVRIEEKKDGVDYSSGKVSKDLLSEDAEKTLFERLQDCVLPIDDSLKDDDFEGVMQIVATLRGPIDAFFDTVTVNADSANVRVNRLRLLSKIRLSLSGVANFEVIEG